MSQVIYETRGQVAYLTLNRPEAMNATNPEMAEAIRAACEEIDQDPNVRAAVVTGMGRAFSTGRDLKLAREEGERGKPPLGREEEMYQRRLLRVRKPVIAAVNGYALGGGMDLALSCDIRYAAEEAVFGMTEVRWNMTPGQSLALLLATVPTSVALEMAFRGHHLSADEALRVGLVSRVLPQADLLQAVEKVANEIATNAPLAVRATKDLARRILLSDLDTVVRLDAAYLHLLGYTEDAKEGPRAFGEKRAPQYQDR